MKHPLLKIDKLNFSYGNQLILKQLSLQLSKKEIVAIIGRSGSGKTTLFRTIARLSASDCGSIHIANVEKQTNSVAYMMQEDLLLPWRSVIDNVLLGVELGKGCSDRKAFRGLACSLLEETGLKGYENHLPQQLSGGMRQRVALARALLQRRPLLLLDEPFGALDICVREQMIDLVKEMRDKHSLTILMITHDFRDALFLSDRVILLRDGALQKQWKIDIGIRENPAAMGEMQAKLHEALI